MELEFSRHANIRMREHGILLSDIIETISAPSSVLDGPTAIEYDGVTHDGRPMRVALAKTTPPLVITVFPIEE